MLDASYVGQIIEFSGEEANPEGVASFRVATCSQYGKGIPLTYCTLFRHGEYAWLEKLGIEVRELLHGEQEYEFKEPLQVSKPLTVLTKLASIKERKTAQTSLAFVVLSSDVLCEGKVAVVSKTTFVVRRVS